MSSQWNSKGFGNNQMISALQSGVLDETVVILMQGKNTFGDRIYSFLKATVKDIMRMQAAIKSGAPFNPSDFGTVLAAGKGEPPEEVRAEIASSYKILDNRSSGGSGAAAPPPAKAWDDY